MTTDPNKERRERYMREGRCTRCGRPKEDTFAKMCVTCIERGRRESKKYYDRKLSKGKWRQRCSFCGGDGHQARTCKKKAQA